MPPTKPTNSVGAEDALAARMQDERERRGWSPARLAAELTATGCPMTQSAIWKIENGQPRRRITLDEAVAMSRLWNIPIERLIA